MSTYHHGDLREALLRSAGKLLEKKGVPGLSLREAARLAKVSHNAPYRHFPDRDSLLKALAEQAFADLGERLKAAGRGGMAEAYVGFALQNPQRFRLVSASRGEAMSAYQELIEVFKRQGDAQQARAAAAAAWSLVHGLAHLLLDGHFEAEQREAGGATPFVRRVLGAVRYSLAAQRSA
jgi:AcrR family transcriptional regulator